MASLAVVTWKPAGSSWLLLPLSDQCSSRNTSQLFQCHSKTTNFTRKTAGTAGYQGNPRSLFTYTRPQTTAYETLLPALLECWEGPVQVTLDTPRNADLFVNLVTCGLKPKNITNRSSADVNLCGAVLWNARYVLSNIRLQLVQNRLTPCGKKFWMH